MKLIYQIPDQLYYIQNFLDYNNYKGIHDAIFKERKKINKTLLLLELSKTDY